MMGKSVFYRSAHHFHDFFHENDGQHPQNNIVTKVEKARIVAGKAIAYLLGIANTYS